jgi:adenine-specific DNA glycosylase
VAACIVDEEGRWLVRRVDEGPILRGLWLPPLVELADGADPGKAAMRLVPFTVIQSPKPGNAVRHNITHRKIDVIPLLFETAHSEPPTEAWRWVDPKKPGLPTSSLFAKLVDSLAERR